MRLSLLWLVALLWPASTVLAQQQDAEALPKPWKERLELSEKLDEALPRYLPREGGVEGRIEIACSRLTEPLLRRWAADFQAIYPGAKVAVKATEYSYSMGLNGGYSDPFGVLTESSGDTYGVLNPSYGLHPWPVIVGFDQLEMIVHPSRSLPKLHVDEIACVYSDQGDSNGFAFEVLDLKLLEHPRIDFWKELETGPAPPPLLAAPIHVYEREYDADDSAFLELRTVGPPMYSLGTTAHFPRMPRDDVRIVQDAAAMVKAIAHDLHGIGYVSHSQLTERVRAVPVEGEPREEFRTKEEEKKQPYHVDLPALARPVYLWIEPADEATRPPLQTEFFKYILSHQGQEAVPSKGFFPLPAALAATQAKAARNLKKPLAPRIRSYAPYGAKTPE